MQADAKPNPTIALLTALARDLGRDASRSPPAESVLQPVPPPADILRDVPLPPRIRSALTAMVEHEPRRPGTWNVARLLSVPGFGLGSLLEIIRAAELACEEPPSGRQARLEQDLAPLLGKRPRSSAVDAPPLLRRALRLIAARAPAAEHEILTMLREAGLTHGQVRLSHIERACRFLQTPLPFRILRRGDLSLVVPVERALAADQIQMLAVRMVTAWGAADVLQVARQAGNEDQVFVARVISARRRFAWLEAAQRWFWYETDDSRLIRLLERALREAPGAPLEELAQRVFQHRPPEHVLPGAALRGLIQQVPRLRALCS